MVEISAVALFCEDLREEKDNKISLIGIMGDNIAVPGFPGALAKLAIYIRINYPTDMKPQSLEIVMTHSDGERLVVNNIDESFVKKTIEEAAAQNNPVAGIVTQLIAAPFAINSAGRNKLELTWDNGSIFLGSLNVILAEKSE